MSAYAIIVFLCGIVHAENEENRFCLFKCGKNHTVCQRLEEKCRPSDQCPPSRRVEVLTTQERVQMLHLHNQKRNAIALGEETRGGNSKASNMMALKYSVELEFVAQCWANACVYSHDTCRSTENFEDVGQNIFHGLNEGANLEKSMTAWYAQIDNSNAVYLDRFVVAAEIQIGYFTTLVWAKTTHVGCGRIILDNHVLIVCNYGPKGNIPLNETYKRGEPCSSCPAELECNSDYAGLCGEIGVDDFEASFSLDSAIKESSCALVILFLIIALINM